MPYEIYAVTNTVNGKVYIGQTRNWAQHRWWCHVVDSRRSSRPLPKDIRQFGKDNFWLTILAIAKDQDEADRLERHWIYKCRSYEPDRGYNLDRGGQHPRGIDNCRLGVPLPESQRRHISIAVKRACKDKDPEQMMAAARAAREHKHVSLDKVLTLYAGGLTTRAIAKRLHVCQWSIWNRLKKAGVEMRPAHG